MSTPLGVVRQTHPYSTPPYVVSVPSEQVPTGDQAIRSFSMVKCLATRVHGCPWRHDPRDGRDPFGPESGGVRDRTKKGFEAPVGLFSRSVWAHVARSDLGEPTPADGGFCDAIGTSVSQATTAFQLKKQGNTNEPVQKSRRNEQLCFSVGLLSPGAQTTGSRHGTGLVSSFQLSQLIGKDAKLMT